MHGTMPKSFLLLIALLTWAPTACTKEPPAVNAPTRIENPSLAIAVAAVPATFEIVTADGPTIELRRTDETGVAQLTIEATGDLQGGINLVAEAESMQDWFMQQPDGQYYGNLELGTPTGPAFTARGAYRDGETAIEELRVFAMHPTAHRMLRLTYRYSPGTGKERLQQLAEVLGEIEALAPEAQNASDN